MMSGQQEIVVRSGKRPPTFFVATTGRCEISSAMAISLYSGKNIAHVMPQIAVEW